MLTKAKQVFDELSSPNIISWTSLIAGYCDNDSGVKALECFEEMKEDQISPNDVTFACVLRACSYVVARGKGQEIHEEIERQGLLERNLFLGSTLVDMYAKFGYLRKAKDVFDNISITRNDVAWNTLISAYTTYGCGDEALECCEWMQNEGISPTDITFVCSLNACASIRSIRKGKILHAITEAQGLLERDVVIGSSLVDMYAKCGHLSMAHQVFDEIPLRNVVAWTALISGYVENENFVEALDLLEQMQHEGIAPNSVTYLCILKACGNLRAIRKGEEIHNDLKKQGFLQKDVVIGNAIIDMYAKCGLLGIAKEVLNKIPIRNVVSWTSLIAGYNDHGYGEEALRCFEEMKLQGISPNNVTFVCALDACGNINALEEGITIHAEIERQGFRERDDSSIGNALVDMYTKCGLLSIGQEIFSRLRNQSLVSWTALIAGYAKHGHGEKALYCFENMQSHDVSPDVVTYFWCLKACGLTGAINKGVEIHLAIERQALFKKDIILNNALIEMYIKCGSLNLAQQVFDKIQTPDMVSWTILIGGYVEHGHGEDAIKCFERFRSEGISPNAFLLVYIMKACGMIGASEKVEEIHAYIESQGLLEKDLVIGNTLLDIYAKCGSLEKAQEVFAGLPVRDVVAWTSLMTGYTQLGETENVFIIFDRMLGEGISPDKISFLVVLTACTRKGLLDKSWTYFEAMSQHYGIAPSIHHHACMLDVLSRSGHLHKALEIIKESEFRSDLVIWRSILESCRNWGNLKMGLEAFEHAVNLDNKHPLAHMYASADIQPQKIHIGYEV